MKKPAVPPSPTVWIVAEKIKGGYRDQQFFRDEAQAQQVQIQRQQRDQKATIELIKTGG